MKHPIKYDCPLAEMIMFLDLYIHKFCYTCSGEEKLKQQNKSNKLQLYFDLLLIYMQQLIVWTQLNKHLKAFYIFNIINRQNQLSWHPQHH